MKARRLRNLRVKRVDLVGAGANQGAGIVLFKALDAPPEPEKPKTCAKCNAEVKNGDKFCASCGADMTVKTAAKAAKEQVMPENTEQIQKLQGDLEAATKLAEEESLKREVVEKAQKDQAVVIEQLKKRLDESEAEIKKAQDAAKLAEFKKTVDAFEHLPVKADVFAPVLKKASEAMSAEEYAELMRVLKAADAAGAGNFIEQGTPGHDTQPQGAQAEVDAKVAELVAKGAKQADALSRVMQENPKLYARARKEGFSNPRAEKEDE